MQIKLVADSSANVKAKINLGVSYAPLKIVTAEREFIDNDQLDTVEMLDYLSKFKGSSNTSCPSISEWTDTFGEADMVLGVAISSNLSGSYNAGKIAADEYMAGNQNSKVFILDSLSTGPEMQLILEKYDELIKAGKDFEEIKKQIIDYSKHTHIVFSLSSINLLAKNGRVGLAKAKAIGILGLKIIGKGSDKGTIEPIHKCRGEKKALNQLVDTIRDMGYIGGKMRISHTRNIGAAEELAKIIKEVFPHSDISICENGGLCSYYSEDGGIIVGFEDM